MQNPLVLIYIGINPSNAGAVKNDPTVTRAIMFAKRLGLGGVVFVNAFTLINSKPSALLQDRDPVGPLADRILGIALSMGGTVVAGWGNPHERLTRRLHAVEDIAAQRGVRMSCFGRNGNGTPRHIQARGRARVPDDQPLVLYRANESCWWCDRPAAYLCDTILGGATAITCDAGMCSSHASLVGAGHVCSRGSGRGCASLEIHRCPYCEVLETPPHGMLVEEHRRKAREQAA